MIAEVEYLYWAFLGDARYDMKVVGVENKGDRVEVKISHLVRPDLSVRRFWLAKFDLEK